MFLDTSALIEIFQRGEKAQDVLDAIRGKRVFVSVLSLAEMRVWALKNGVDLQRHHAFLNKNTTIVGLNLEIADEAGHLRFALSKKDVGLIDCLIASTAEFYSLQVLSLDRHFENFRNALVL